MDDVRYIVSISNDEHDGIHLQVKDENYETIISLVDLVTDCPGMTISIKAEYLASEA